MTITAVVITEALANARHPADKRKDGLYEMESLLARMVREIPRERAMEIGREMVSGAWDLSLKFDLSDARIEHAGQRLVRGRV